MSPLIPNMVSSVREILIVPFPEEYCSVQIHSIQFSETTLK